MTDGVSYSPSPAYKPSGGYNPRYNPWIEGFQISYFESSDRFTGATRERETYHKTPFYHSYEDGDDFDTVSNNIILSYYQAYNSRLHYVRTLEKQLDVGLLSFDVELENSGRMFYLSLMRLMYGKDLINKVSLPVRFDYITLEIDPDPRINWVQRIADLQEVEAVAVKYICLLEKHVFFTRADYGSPEDFDSLFSDFQNLGND